MCKEQMNEGDKESHVAEEIATLLLNYSPTMDAVDITSVVLQALLSLTDFLEGSSDAQKEQKLQVCIWNLKRKLEEMDREVYGGSLGENL